MKLLILTLCLSFVNAIATELDPTPSKAIVLKIDEDTNQMKAYKLESLPEEESEVSEILNESNEINDLSLVNLSSATELEQERSVGNYYFYYYNYGYSYNYNYLRNSYFYYNTYRYNYYSSYYTPWNNRYRYFYYYY